MINTVTGPIRKDELGVTLSHEHIYWDSTDVERMYFNKVYDMERVERLYNELIPVFKELYNLGCRAIAETSPPEGGQNLMLMVKLSKESGIKLIPNTGMIYGDYKEAFKVEGEDYHKKLAEQWFTDFKEGLDIIDNVVIRPSHIKMFFNDDRLSTVDKKLLDACIVTSKETGLPIHCHIIKSGAVKEVIDILEDENFDFSKFLWAHVGYDDKFHLINEAVKKGMWLGFDIIQRKNYDKYVYMIKNAIANGYSDKILLSSDYDFYEQVSENKNNHPCGSLFTDFISYCEENGISRDTLINILSRNPGNFYDIEYNY